MSALSPGPVSGSGGDLGRFRTDVVVSYNSLEILNVVSCGCIVVVVVLILCTLEKITRITHGIVIAMEFLWRCLRELWK